MLKYALIPFLPLAAFVFNGLLGRWLKDKAHWPPLFAVLFSFVLAVSTLFEVMGGGQINHVLYSWITSGGFDVHIGFKIDQLTAVMLIVVTTVSSLVHIYSVGYMHGDNGYPRFFAYLALFTFSMLMLVMADNFLQLYVFWEAVGLCSYFLIGFWYEKKSASDAGKKAFVVNRVGDFGFGLGVMLIFITFGTLNYDAVFATAGFHAAETVNIMGGTYSLMTVIALLLFTGAVGKSAQLPLHVWLPDAMEGPTPVSALIHAATMVTAGVFMVARCHPIFNLSPVALDVVTWTGGITALFAATIALTQYDIKRVVAYSTISQLGYMFVACGVGAYTAGIFHLMTHAFFKGLLFLGAGSVIHAMSGEQDMRNMGGLRKAIPWTFYTFMLASLSISGFPFFAGFFSKDEILWMAFTSHGAGHTVYYLLAIAAFLTAFYSFRVIFMTFCGDCRASHEVAHHVHESPKVMILPLVILATLAVVAGYVGVPEVLHGSNWFHGFMAHVFGGGHEAVEGMVEGGASEFTMMLVSILIGVSGIGLAWFMYIVKPDLPGKVAGASTAVYNLLYNKYYIDEIYDFVLVNPVKWASTHFFWKVVDVSIIDAFVNAVASLVDAMSRVLRRLQSGYFHHYAMGMALGVFVIVGVFLFIR
ncbi:MAG: NADH-quinone oxidoreductase subunit L [Nitrospirae bacterium]|nr:NADH-quinone oxidoreductase subunit L [Nitrospirota bacterium]